jgi:hypothetical protein
MKVDRITATPDPLNSDRYLVSVFWKTAAGKMMDSVVRNDDASVGLLGALPEHLGCLPPPPKCNPPEEADGSRRTKS